MEQPILYMQEKAGPDRKNWKGAYIMPVVFFNTYKLKKAASVPDFLLAVENLNNEYISKQKGYISFQLLLDGETWADSTTFETMEDAKNFASASDPNGFAQKFYSFLNLNSCKSNFFTVQKDYKGQ